MKKQIIILLIILIFVYGISKMDFKTSKKTKGVMKIKIVRKEFTDKSTIGEMFIDGKFFCYTLEDKVREKKIKGVTAIPKGVYDTIVNVSARFGKPMPRLTNVPNFDGILIHNGNTAENTDGCILVGSTKAKDFIGNSRKTFTILMEMINLFYKTNPTGTIQTEIL